MRRKTHMAVGLAAGLALGIESPIALAAVVVGSAIPDIDNLGVVVPKFTTHRGLTHSLTLSALLYGVYMVIASYSYYSELLLYGLLGVLTHIVLDLTNEKGIQLFWPYRKRYSLGIIKYDGVIEKLLWLAFTCLNVYMIYLKFA